MFHTTEQQANKTVYKYMICLCHLAEPCNFDTLHDEMVRDQLVLGSQDKGTQACLFREKDRYLKKALEVLQISKATYAQLQEIGTA